MHEAGSGAGELLTLAWLPTLAVLAVSTLSTLRTMLPAIDATVGKAEACGLFRYMDWAILVLWVVLWVLDGQRAERPRRERER